MTQPASAGVVVPVRTMGTVVTLDLRTDLVPGRRREVVAEAAALLESLDADLSLWRADSWLSRLTSGQVEETACPEHVRAVLDLTERAERLTDGWFSGRWSSPSASPSGPAGAGSTPDPTGLIKGWAASKVSDLLLRAGVPDHLVNAAGDVVLAGRPAPGATAWRVGISDPADSRRLLGALALPGGGRWAVATSGPAERGAHIRNPRTGRSATAVTFATVVADEMIARARGFPDAGSAADAAATALVAAEWDAPGLAARLRSRGLVTVVEFADGTRLDPDHLLPVPAAGMPPAPGSSG